MAEEDAADVFLAKALESLTGAQSEISNARYNNGVNRCYYSCFQAAVAALLREGIAPSGVQWNHSFVQSQFVGQLIHRRKTFPGDFRDVLTRLSELRRVGDYQSVYVSEAVATRALRRTRAFVQTVRSGGGI